VAAVGDPLWSDLRFGPGVVFADGVKKGAAQAVPLFSVATNAVMLSRLTESITVGFPSREVAIRNQSAT